jgi:D-alanyl-D-alanine carboxypeptidase
MRRIGLILLAALLVAAVTDAAPAQSPKPPPPTPVPPVGSPSPFPSTLETPAPSNRPPRLSAPSAALLDLETGRLLFEQGAGIRRPVASTTKIMTALVVLEETDPDEIVSIDGTATRQGGSTLGLRSGERISVRDLLFALMLQSANDAAVALAEHVAGSVGDFVKLINRRAREMGLRDTRFASPNGLDDSGYSTARDMAAITFEAYRNPEFVRIVRTRFRSIPAPRGRPRRIQNRNALLWLYPGAIGVKTGFTAAAGFSLVAAADRDDLRLASVVLGGPSDAFSDSAALLDYGFMAFERRVVLEEGDRFDPSPGGIEVAAVAGATLEALVHRDAELVYQITPEPRASAGEAVGTVVVRAAGLTLGEVPLLAVEPAAPAENPRPESSSPPWWRRAVDSMSDSVVSLLRSIF